MDRRKRVLSLTQHPRSMPLSSFVCESMHTTFYKPAGMAQPAPGAIPSVSYIINTWSCVLRASWGILTGSRLLRTFIGCMVESCILSDFSLSSQEDSTPYQIVIKSVWPEPDVLIVWKECGLSHSQEKQANSRRRGRALGDPGHLSSGPMCSGLIWFWACPFAHQSGFLYLQNRINTSFCADLLEQLQWSD